MTRNGSGRRRLAVGVGLPFVCLLGGVPAGCFSSSAGPGDDAGEDVTVPDEGAPQLDAYVAPGAEAAAPEAAPEAGSEPSPEAAPVDAPADTFEASGPAPVTVTIRTLGGPEAGVTIVFDDAQGNYLSSATTNAAGVVSQLVTPGSQITALFGDPAVALQLFTWVGVQPGDVLTALDTTSVPGVASAAPTLSLTMPTATAPGSPDSYSAFSGICSNQGFVAGPTSFDLSAGGWPDCFAEAQMPLLLVAMNGSTETAYTFDKAVSLFGGDGGGPVAALDGNTWTASSGTTQTVTVNNPAQGAGQTYAYFGEVADGVSFPAPSVNITGAPDAGMLATSFPTHPGYPDSVQAEIDFPPASSVAGCGGGVRALATSQAAPSGSGSVTFDGTQVLPTITSSTFSIDLDAGTPDRPQLSWIAQAPLDAADGIVVQLPWQIQLDGGQYLQALWTFVVPSTYADLTAPALPPSSPWSPANQNVPYNLGFAGLGPNVAAVRSTSIGSYAALRQGAGVFAPAMFDSVYTSGATLVPPLPFLGTLSMSLFYWSGC